MSEEEQIDLINKEAIEPVVQWLTFMLADEHYGMKVTKVQEVLRYVAIAPVPGAADFVLGIINLRGNVVTVIDARNRFGMSAADISDLTRIIILEIEGQIIGVLVDSVSEVIDLKDDEVESAPESNDETSIFIQGIAHKNDKLHILIDLDRLMSDEDLNG